jgi:murein DD-endopeptidase MepM/ murein hydrolase activator NlpD
MNVKGRFPKGRRSFFFPETNRALGRALCVWMLLFSLPGAVLRAQELAAAPVPRCALLPDNPRPGDPLTVALVPEGENHGIRTAALFTLKGKRLSGASFFSVPVEKDEKPLAAAILAVPSTAEPGFAFVRIEGAGGILAEIPLVITGRDFASDVIELNPVLTDIRTLPDPQKTAESQRLWAIISSSGKDIYTTDCFVPPVTSTRRTSFFGDRRVYKYSNGKTDTSIHAGVDYGVPRGTVVSACASGRVVLACFRIVTGNSVVIEHLPGVYSIYYHLDTIEAAEGALVKAGARLGLSGSTGLATGPHLHWEIRVGAENADPDAFMARPVLDKTAIFAKLETIKP